MRVFYATAEKIWEELGVFHYSNRLNFNDFLEELRKRIPHTWSDGLIDKAKFIYFAVMMLYNLSFHIPNILSFFQKNEKSKEKGSFPRWYTFDQNIKDERSARAAYDADRREFNVIRSKLDIEVCPYLTFVSDVLLAKLKGYHMILGTETEDESCL
jgi:hypothetical protein